MKTKYKLPIKISSLILTWSLNPYRMKVDVVDLVLGQEDHHMLDKSLAVAVGSGHQV